MEIIKTALTARDRDYIKAVSTLMGSTEQPSHRQNSPHTHRTTIEFGCAYRELKKGKRQFSNPPPAISLLFDYARQALLKSHGASISIPENFDNCILSCYQTGDQLQPHIDIDEKSYQDGRTAFYFGEPIIGLVLQSDSTGCLYLQHHTGASIPVYDPETAAHLEEKNGLAFIFTHEARHAPYYHGVSPVTNSRISLTYRTLITPSWG